MNDFVDEELEIMDEQCKSEDHKVSQGIDIEDPIRVLNMVPIIKCTQDLSLEEVINLMNDSKLGCMVIENSSGKPVGIFTERDILRRVIGKDLDLKKEKVKDFMTHDPEILSEDDPISYALNKMSAGSYRHIPITHKGEVKFMLSVKDIVDHIAFTYRQQVLNLPPDLRETSGQYGG